MYFTDLFSSSLCFYLVHFTDLSIYFISVLLYLVYFKIYILYLSVLLYVLYRSFFFISMFLPCALYRSKYLLYLLYLVCTTICTLQIYILCTPILCTIRSIYFTIRSLQKLGFQMNQLRIFNGIVRIPFLPLYHYTVIPLYRYTVIPLYRYCLHIP